MIPKTKTPSDTAMIEALARKMGGVPFEMPTCKWRTTRGPAYKFADGGVRFLDNRNGNWNPLESLDQVYRVEERLTEEERERYVIVLNKSLQEYTEYTERNLWMVRHADARTCATALALVVAPELFEGGGE